MITKRMPVKTCLVLITYLFATIHANAGESKMESPYLFMIESQLSMDKNLIFYDLVSAYYPNSKVNDGNPYDSHAISIVVNDLDALKK